MNVENNPVVEARGITRSFGEDATRVDALRGVDLDVSRGEFVAVAGPSGSGKSTLLHILGGLDAPTRGSVKLDGRDLNKLDDDSITLLRRRLVGFVFQSFNLIDVLTAGENVALPLVLDGEPEPEANSRARSALERVGLAQRVEHYPGELAGGEQQRVALARALCTEPVLLLADEPTGNLDTRAGARIVALLRRLVDEHGQTVVMVTHDTGFAAMADRVITLRDGRIEDEQKMPRSRPAGDVLGELDTTP